MTKNYFCETCEDTGEVGLIFKTTCPRCEGDPNGYFLKTFKVPEEVPPSGQKQSDIRNKER